MTARAPHCLLLALVVAAPSLAHGDGRVALDWSAPEGCPDRSAVLAELDRLVAAPLSSEPQSPMHARGSVVRDGGLFRLHLELKAGDRDLQDASCARLGQVVALSLALALETGTTASVQPQPLEPPPTPKPPPVPEVGADDGSPRWIARAFLGGDLGSLRSPSPGPGLAVGLLLGQTRLELGGAYWFPQTVSGLEYQLVSVGLHACRAVTEGLEIGLCAGVDGGRMQVRFVSTGSSVVHAWLGLMGGAALGWSFTSWLALRLEVGVGLTLVGPDLGSSEEGRGPSPVFGRASLGLEVRLR